MSTPSFVSTIIKQLYRTEQVDLLHVAITNLMEMIEAGEVDLILDQRGKSAAQKKAFVQKIISSVESPELKKELEAQLKSGELAFFRERTLAQVMKQLQKEAAEITIVKLTVAVTFVDNDLKDMVKQLETQLGNKVVLDLALDHSLVGGAIVQYGKALRDYSIKARLKQFQDHWKTGIMQGWARDEDPQTDAGKRVAKMVDSFTFINQ